MPICQYHARGPSRALEFSSRWIIFLGFLQKIWLWWKNMTLFYNQKKKVLRFYVVSFWWPWYILKWRIDVISGSPESFWFILLITHQNPVLVLILSLKLFESEKFSGTHKSLQEVRRLKMATINFLTKGVLVEHSRYFGRQLTRFSSLFRNFRFAEMTGWF